MHRHTHPIRIAASVRARPGLGQWAVAMLAGLALALAWAATACAAPAGEQQALDVVRGWLAHDARPLGTAMAASGAAPAMKATRFDDARGAPAYYAVSLASGGFVIVAGDDSVEPIVAFSPTGYFDASAANPLGALVSADLPGRVAAARAQAGLSGALAASAAGARGKWQRLSRGGDLPAATHGLYALSDMRVAPLVATTWDQLTAGGVKTYNYYTPSNLFSGCVATALGQLMRYHRHPVQGVGTPSFLISVNHYPRTVSLRGGDGAGGPYRWDDMVATPGASATTAQRQAIGALLADAGTSVNMQYTASGSGADTLRTASALTGPFGYANARTAYDGAANLPAANRDTMVNTNLDAGLPVLFGITGPNGGHAVVGDGYGYNQGTQYHHLNMGWSGAYNLWYNLPSIDSGYRFSSVYKLVYNVFPSGRGEIVSGRVTDSLGQPLAGASVSAACADGPRGAVTDARGIFALVGVAAHTTCALTGTKDGYAFAAGRSVTTGLSIDRTTITGNVWGADLQGTLVATTGSISLALAPQAALASAAAWRVDGGQWLTSGATVVDLSAGTHLVEFADAAGYVAPAPLDAIVQAGQTTHLTATYDALPTGALTVAVRPAGAVAAGAKWRVDGGSWQADAAVLHGLTPGTHVVEYLDVAGWIEPEAVQVEIAADAIASLEAVYGPRGVRYSVNRAAAFAWLDDSGGTTLGDTVADDAAYSVPLGFTFRFFGRDYTSVHVSSNGFLSFTNAVHGLAGARAIPSAAAPNAMVAAYWDDIYFSPALGSRISWKKLGDSPQARLVITWRDGTHYSLRDAGGPRLRFQAVLEEATGRITLQYASVTVGDAAHDNGATATVGIEDETGTTGVSGLVEGSRLTAGQAIVYTPKAVASGLPVGALLLLLPGE